MVRDTSAQHAHNATDTQALVFSCRLTHANIALLLSRGGCRTAVGPHRSRRLEPPRFPVSSVCWEYGRLGHRSRCTVIVRSTTYPTSTQAKAPLYKATQRAWDALSQLMYKATQRAWNSFHAFFVNLGGHDQQTSLSTRGCLTGILRPILQTTRSQLAQHIGLYTSSLSWAPARCC